MKLRNTITILAMAAVFSTTASSMGSSPIGGAGLRCPGTPAISGSLAASSRAATSVEFASSRAGALPLIAGISMAIGRRSRRSPRQR